MLYRFCALLSILLAVPVVAIGAETGEAASARSPGKALTRAPGYPRVAAAEFPCEAFSSYMSASRGYPKKEQISLQGLRYSVAYRTDEQQPLKTKAGLFTLEVTGSGWHVASLVNAEGVSDGPFDGGLMFGAYLLRSDKFAFMVMPTSGLPGDDEIIVYSLNRPKADVVCVVRQKINYSPNGILARFAHRKPWPVANGDLNGFRGSFGDKRPFDDASGPYAPSDAETLNNAGPFYFSAQYFGSTARMQWKLRVGEETTEVFRVNEPDLGQENECVTLAVYGPSTDPAILCTGVGNVITRYSNRSKVPGAPRTLRLEEVEAPVVRYRALSRVGLKTWKAEKQRIRNAMR